MNHPATLRRLPAPIRTFLATCVVLLLMPQVRAAAGDSGSLCLTNFTLRPDGCAFMEVAGVTNGAYTLETSTDLQTWRYGMALNVTNNRCTITSPEPITGADSLFLRVRAGQGVYAELNLHFGTQPGTFGAATSPAISFPVPLAWYTANLMIDQDTDFPAPTQVLFTGPAGSGVSSGTADQFGVDTDNGKAWYQSPFTPPAAASLGGTWVVNYKGTDQRFTLPDPEIPTHLVIPAPVVTVGADGTLQSVAWTFRDPVTGAVLPSESSRRKSVALQLEHSDGLEHFERIYQTTELPPDTTQHVLTTNVAWTQVTVLHLVYDDDRNNHYVASYHRQSRW
ncbi:MAG: hypothetical protein ACYDC1_02865 [Limisphaerales bacterium]